MGNFAIIAEYVLRAFRIASEGVVAEPLVLARLMTRFVFGSIT